MTGCGSFGSWATATWVETAEHHFDRPRLYGLRPFDGYHFLGYLEGLTNYVYKSHTKVHNKFANPPVKIKAHPEKETLKCSTKGHRSALLKRINRAVKVTGAMSGNGVRPGFLNLFKKFHPPLGESHQPCFLS